MVVLRFLLLLTDVFAFRDLIFICSNHLRCSYIISVSLRTNCYPFIFIGAFHRLLSRLIIPFVVHKIPRSKGSGFWIPTIQVFASFNLILSIVVDYEFPFCLALAIYQLILKLWVQTCIKLWFSLTK